MKFMTLLLTSQSKVLPLKEEIGEKKSPKESKIRYKVSDDSLHKEYYKVIFYGLNLNVYEHFQFCIGTATLYSPTIIFDVIL